MGQKNVLVRSLVPVRDALQRVARPTPPIVIDHFARSQDIPYVDRDTAQDTAEDTAEDGPLTSELARFGRLQSPAFRDWLKAMALEPLPHRKRWELAYIAQAVQEAGALKPGARGLVFAAGQERLPALFAARGCHITATDLAGDDGRSAVWADTDQWAGGIEAMDYPEICPPDLLAKRVTFRPVDMNDIPADLRGYDFAWSTCSFEHCGSLQLGADFVVNQMACLKPGGIAVHTTEFNLSSNDATIEAGETVIFRLRDIEALVRRLRAEGHDVAPLNIWPGDHEIDRFVDRIQGSPRRYPLKKHMRLLLDGYVSTSIGLIIKKASEVNDDPAQASQKEGLT